MKTKPEANLARRNFLRALGAGAGVAAVARRPRDRSESGFGKRR